MPRRDDFESNLDYAWRIRGQNPGASVNDIAHAVVGDSGGRPEVVARDLNARIAACEKISGQFGTLRTISKDEAESLGFMDAAVHGEDATACLFGEDLSLGNPNQRVIGLVQIASDRPHGFDANVNKAVVFMDMNKLAEYLVSNPKHPMNNARLNANNIGNFAFRIS